MGTLPLTGALISGDRTMSPHDAVDGGSLEQPTNPQSICVSKLRGMCGTARFPQSTVGHESNDSYTGWPCHTWPWIGRASPSLL